MRNAASDAANVRRLTVNARPALAFDHVEIIATARRRSRMRLGETADAFGFLATTLTLDELRTTDQSVVGKQLDPRESRSRTLAL